MKHSIRKPWINFARIVFALTIAICGVASSVYANTDPYADNVVLLMHMNGENGSTDFADEKGHVVSPSGSVIISTAESKFGSASASFTGADQVLATQSLNDFGFGDQAFTVEMWVNPSSNTTDMAVFDSRSNAAELVTGIGIYSSIDGHSYKWGIANNSAVIATGSVLTPNEWAHLAVSRDNNGVVRGFRNGQLEFSVSDARTYSDAAIAKIGAHAGVVQQQYFGYIDELRVTKGVARYTENFTPTTVEFSTVSKRPVTLEDKDLIIKADGLRNVNHLTRFGVDIIQIDNSTYAVKGDLATNPALFSHISQDAGFEELSQLYHQATSPADIYEALSEVFVNPTDIKCLGNELNVGYVVRGTSHAASSAAVGNIAIQPQTDVGAFVYYSNYKDSNRFYGPNDVIDDTDSVYIYDDFTGGVEVPPEASKSFHISESIYTNNTASLSSSMNYGYTRIIALAYNSDISASDTGGEYGYSAVFTVNQSSEYQAGDQFNQDITVINEGLIAHYDFSGNANNVAGNYLDGTVSGATLVEDRFGNPEGAYQFDYSDYIDIGGSYISGYCSAAFWIKKDGGIETAQSLLSGSEGYYIAQFHPMQSTSAGTKINGMGSHFFNYDIPSEQWTHIVFVKNESGLTLYANGVNVGNYITNALNCPLGSIGGSANNTEASFYGVIDDVRIYDRILSEPEIQALYGEVQVTEPITISSNTSITVDNTSYDGKDLIVDGAVLTIDGAHTFGDVQVINGGKIQQSIAVDQNSPKLELSIDNLTIDSNSSIDLSGKGTTGEGVSSEFYAGGSYGGRGGKGETGGFGIDPFGSYYEPTHFGNGGSDNTKNRGGGAVKITANNLELNGNIVANGVSDGPYTPGGSGGSIWLNVSTLSGSGVIQANGADASSCFVGYGGGGGGRIAIYYTGLDGFNPETQITVNGGSGCVSGGEGGIGTIYLSDTNSQVNFNSSITISAGDTSYDGKDITVDGAVLTIDGAHTFGNVQVINGGKIQHSTAVNTNSPKMELTIDFLRVESGSSIDVSGRGLLADGNGEYYGGSYGGYGGVVDTIITPNLPFGNAYEPVDFGYGGSGTNEGKINRGGGALYLEVAGEISLEGSILSNGGYQKHSGGGSGGSIWISANVLTGSGTISANGSNGGTGSGAAGGGGGRVAVYYNDASTFNLDKITAMGGTGYTGYVQNYNPIDGGAGTVYLEDKSLPKDQAIMRVDNGGNTGAVGYTLIPKEALTQGQWLVNNGNNNSVIRLDGDYSTKDSVLNADGVTLELIGSYNFTAINLRNGAKIITSIAEDAESPKLNFKLDNLSIDASSSIDISDKGLLADGNGEYYGGSYGGYGGIVIASNTPNPVFGDLYMPVDFGYGGSGTNEGKINRGGGALYLEVTGEISLEGSILSNGGYQKHSGGGSGGSIWINANVLSGSGTIAANGSNGGNGTGTGGGGGGRIAVYYSDASQFNLENVTAIGGVGYTGLLSNPNPVDGGAGTIVKENVSTLFRVVSATPAGVIGSSVSQVEINFNSPIDMATLTAEDIVVSGPSIPPYTIIQSGSNSVNLEFAPGINIDGNYSISVGPDVASIFGVQMDQDQDEIYAEAGDDVYTLSFTIDTQKPATPVITSHDVQVNPINLTTTSVTLAGSREDNSAIIINGQEKVALGSGDWSTTITLPQGSTDVTVTARDEAGNESEAPVVLNFFVDSIKPVVSSTLYFPAGGADFNANYPFNDSPDYLELQISETGSGIDLDKSDIELRSGGQVVTTAKSIEGLGVRVTPSAPLVQGDYVLSGYISDAAGNQTNAFEAIFYVDMTAPDAPTVDQFPSIVTINQHTFTGTKTADAIVKLNGSYVDVNYGTTTWTATNVSLTEGDNQLTFQTEDKAGNLSEATVVTIKYDNTAPDAVIVTGNGVGVGTEVVLDWTGYDEVANGNDIKEYKVYQSAAAFTDIGAATPVATVASGTKSYTVQGLNRDQTYHYAVVAFDSVDQHITQVTSIAVTTQDTQKPAEISSPVVTTTGDSVTANWTASASDDVAKYKVYFEQEEAQEVIEPTFNKGSLASATEYTIKVTTVDTSGNESTGVTFNAVTFLANPTGLASEALNGMVELSWNAATPADLVKEYAIYQSDAVITDVSVMTPVTKVTSTTGRVAGLDNGTAYHFAVTTINKTGGEDKAVTSITATPEADEQGPEFSNLKYSDASIAGGAVLSTNGKLSIEATDPSAVAFVKLQIDNGVNQTASANGNVYSIDLDLLELTDGTHTITITAEDTLGNATDPAYTVDLTVALAAPEAPAITSPNSGYKTNAESVTVTGTAPANTKVQLYSNEQVVGELLELDAQNKFTTTVDLASGINELKATAEYEGRAVPSQYSMVVSVELDDTIPATPYGLSADGYELSRIELSWSQVNDENVSGYNIYRSLTPITEVATLTPINAQLITQTTYTDVPVEDGEYYYVVTSENDLGTNSLISNVATATADSTLPRAVSISYAPQGRSDDTGDILRIAPGDVAITVEVSEPLYVTPFMSIAYEGAGVTAIELIQQSDLVYTGTYTVTENTPSGNAYALLSMKDMLKNRGTDIDAGEFIIIDAQGPQVNALTVTPSHPIKTDVAEPTEVTVALELSEALPQDQMPQLSYQLSGAGRLETSLDAQVNKVDELNYTATFTLPADAGAINPETPEAENLSFNFSATDDLDNASTTIKGTNSFQVYQGDLPPLSAPLGLSATPKSGGEIKLTWFEVDEAAQYAIFQKAEGEAEFTEIGRTAELEYIVATAADGQYEYGVKTIRIENEEETASAMSEIVTIDSDSTAPQPPTNLTLQLQARGMAVMWEDDVNTGVYYKVYRSDSDSILTVEGLTPLIDTPIYSTAYLDPRPTQDEPGYVVTAVDNAGNESAPSQTAYENVALLPVSSLEVLLEEGQNPVVSWTHTSNTIAGYNLYLNQSETAQNEQLLTELSFEDTGYTDEQREYTLKAQDDNQQQSLGRSIILPKISAQLAEGATIKRGIMNAVDYIVTNESDFDVTGLSLNIDLNGAHQQETVAYSIAAGESKTITAVIGGYKDLPDLTTITTSLIIKPNAGEKVTIKRSDEVLVTESALLLTMETQELTRNATGKVRFTLENTSDVQIEIVTAKQSGRFVSDEISFKLVDDEENVLITQEFKQSTEGNVITIGSDTVARIPAGESFTSKWFDMAIPAAAPGQAKLLLDLKQIHYHLGDTDHAQIAGKQIYTTVNLVDTAYYGELTTIEPVISYGDEDITITGQAINRETAEPMANTPLAVVIKTNSYEKRIDVTTNAEGVFEYNYTPVAGESGTYKVSVIHPDLIERPEHGQFAIGGLSVWPGTYTLRMPNNYQYTVPVKLTAGSGSDINGIHIEYEAVEQPGGEFAVGMSAELPAELINLTAGQQLNTGITITSTEQAEMLGKMVFKVYADDVSEEPISTIIVDYQLSDAVPTLYFSPSVIESGVFIGQSRTHNVVLGNKGFEDLKDVNLSIVEVSEGGIESPAPDWFHITTGQQVGDIAIGQEQEVQIMIAPPAQEPIGEQVYNLRIDSSNHPTRYIQIYAMIVDENAVGNIIFKVEDIYTGTLDASGDRIEGLQGAVIYLEHEQDPAINISVKSGENGEVEIPDLQAGAYRYYITAPDHQEIRGRIRIEPGQTLTERVFLDNTLITVEWSVTEITIEDRYEITLKATYETDVPTAVVVMDPMSFNLPRMSAGEIFNAEVKITNHGLVKAESMDFTLPADTEYLKYELLIDPAEIPQILEAKSFTRIPFRVIQLKPFEAEGYEGTGAGCGNYSGNITCNYSSRCANGDTQNRSSSSRVTYSWGPCPGGAPSAGGGGGGGGGYGGGGGGVSRRTYEVSGMPACREKPKCRECSTLGNQGGM